VDAIGTFAAPRSLELLVVEELYFSGALTLVRVHIRRVGRCRARCPPRLSELRRDRPRSWRLGAAEGRAGAPTGRRHIATPGAL